ncbi:MAG: hypothetical protein R3E42_13865 [Burkholderiaceae bacterium]
MVEAGAQVGRLEGQALAFFCKAAASSSANGVPARRHHQPAGSWLVMPRQSAVDNGSPVVGLP